MENKLQIDTLSEILIKEQKFCAPFWRVFIFKRSE
jgi:hypothetical protein